MVVTNKVLKMFKTVRLSPIDQGTHQLFWRRMNQIKSQDHHQVSGDTFGDKLKGSRTIIGLRVSEQKNNKNILELQNLAMKNTYTEYMLKPTALKQPKELHQNLIQLLLLVV